MKLSTILGAACAVVLSVSSALADGLMIKDAYVRSSTPTSKTGAAFFQIMNHGDQADRLIGVQSDVARRVELHTHIEDANGVMKMREVEAGFPIPAGGMHALERGGDHVMFMGLTQSLEQGSEITVTLTFEKAGEMVVRIPVDHARKTTGGHGSHANHGDMKHD